jgi:hypothetical protein
VALPIKDIGLERTYTPEEFENLPEFEELYELVDGKLVLYIKLLPAVRFIRRFSAKELKGAENLLP